MKLKKFLRFHPAFVALFFSSVLFCIGSLLDRKYIYALVQFIMGIVLCTAVYFIERRNFKELNDLVSYVSSSLDSTDNAQTSAVPLPLAICTGNGALIWYNEIFKTEIVGDEPLTIGDIEHFAPVDRFTDEQYNTFDATFRNKKYSVYVSTGKNNVGYILCFVENTYYKDTVRKYELTRPAVFHISLDAIDDVSSSLTSNDFSSLLNHTERIINDWFAKYDCIIKKNGDGKFFVFCDRSVFDLMKKDKFSIVEKIRNTHLELISSSFTVSMGVAVNMPIVKCDMYAKKSLEMAKGRGGDQVVVNDNNTLSFYGGLSAGTQSRTRVRSRTVAITLEKEIKNASSVFIMGHKSSDLDAIGSAIGLYEAVKELGVKSRIVCDKSTTMAKPLINYYKEKYGDSVFVSPSIACMEFKDDSLLIMTDTMRRDFTDEPLLVDKAKNIAVVDHHRESVDRVAAPLIFFQEHASSSASEMVTELIRYMPSRPKISKEASEALLSGIYLDTKNFTLNTGVRTFEAAAFLKECGANTVTVRKLFSATNEENCLVSTIVGTAKVEHKFAFAFTDKQEDNTRIAAARAADDLLNIENVDASFVFFPINSTDTGVSARSYGNFNVQIVMENLGGGGHFTMAAAQLKNVSIPDAIKRVKEIVFAK